jgi:hypothetical protein
LSETSLVVGDDALDLALDVGRHEVQQLDDIAAFAND